jgi:pilus assembly protein CpaC
MRLKMTKPTLGLSLIAAIWICFAPSADAQQMLRVTKGKSIVLEYPQKIKTISIADQEIADVVSITPTDLVIIGKKEGETSLVVWGEDGKYTSYVTKVDRNTIDQQVAIEVQIAEVVKTDLSEYGLDFLFIDTDPKHIGTGDKIIGSYAGGVTPPDPDSKKLFIPDGTTGVLRFLGTKQQISAAINALQRDNKIRMLASPRLICASSEKASFLAGGEIPVPIAQTGLGGFSTITIEWKEFGVKLDFVPTIIDTNLISLRIAPEVSSLDFSNAITVSGFNIPALRTRKADATVEMNSSQAVVLGGLKSTEENKTIRRVPVLGYIPILNFFFSRRETSRQDTDLLIIISPRIITSVAKEVIPPLPFQPEPK